MATSKPFLPPRFVIRAAWAIHRAIYRISGGRRGLRPPTSTFGTMRIHTIGRRSGAKRVAILGYFEDGPNLFTLAMNGWGDPDPPGGSTCRRILTPRSTCRTGPVRSRREPPPATSGPGCGPRWPSTSRTSTATRRADRARRPSSCSSPARPPEQARIQRPTRSGLKLGSGRQVSPSRLSRAIARRTGPRSSTTAISADSSIRDASPSTSTFAGRSTSRTVT